MSTRNSAGFISNAARWLVAAWLLLGAGLALAQPAHVETFHLHHRSAHAMMPLLRPLLEPEDGMTGSGHTLIVRSTPERLKAIGQAIKQFDRAPVRLLITVRQGVDTSGSDGADARVYSTESNGQHETDQQLQVTEGRWAHIATGELVPLPEQSVTATQNGVASQQGIRYKAFTSGFEVRPELSGKSVTLQIRPFQTQASPMGDGRYSVQSLSTTVSGRLGQWIPLGGEVVNSDSGSGDSVVYSTEPSGEREQRIFLKVERLH